MVLENFRLDGQVAIVTGAGRGIGAAIAVAYAEAGTLEGVDTLTRDVMTPAGAEPAR